jgi:hypothetical protein
MRTLSPRIVFTLVVTLAACVALAACGASSAEIRRAKDAEYDAREYATVFEACKATMIESGYDLALEDVEHGILVSEWRWYSKEGAAKKKDAPRIEDGAAMFRIGVELARGPKGGIIVHVDGGAQGYNAGSPVAQQFKHGDPREPTWVEGKIDNLAVGIHSKLSAVELKPGATPANSPAVAPVETPAAAPDAGPAEPPAAPAPTN